MLNRIRPALSVPAMGQHQTVLVLQKIDHRRAIQSRVDYFIRIGEVFPACFCNAISELVVVFNFPVNDIFELPDPTIISAINVPGLIVNVEAFCIKND